MASAYVDKWIRGTSPDDSVAEVAGQTLQSRLAAVQHYLPLAAEKADQDVEYVHQLRVFTRRATASLRLYADLLPRGRAKWVQKQLRRIRHAANDARDYDVLARRWDRDHPGAQGERLRAHVREQRAEAQTQIVAIHERLQRDDRLARRIASLLRRVGPRGKDKAELKRTCFGAWARARLRPLVETFFQAAPADGSDAAALHQFRIRGKELRYAMELLGGAFPAELRDKLYPVVETLQDMLGEINDHATAALHLRGQLEEAKDPGERNHLHRVLDREKVHYEQACQAFLAWWTPRQQEALRSGFEALLARPAARTRRRVRAQGLSVPAGQGG
jgi:CHAD domain-containing protein